MLTALDIMFAAFDILDHITLLHRCQHTFGLSAHVCYFFCISWICSYPADRSSLVKIDSSSSPSTTILTHVSQGSVLGLLLQTSGMHYQIICQPFQPFPLSEELSNNAAPDTTFKKSNTCGVSNNRLLHHLFLVGHPDSNASVRSNQLNLSHFVIRRVPRGGGGYLGECPPPPSGFLKNLINHRKLWLLMVNHGKLPNEQYSISRIFSLRSFPVISPN